MKSSAKACKSTPSGQDCVRTSFATRFRNAGPVHEPCGQPRCCGSVAGPCGVFNITCLPESRSIKVLFEEDDVLSDSELCGPLTQNFFECSQYFIDLPSQLGHGIERFANSSNDGSSASSPSDDGDGDVEGIQVDNVGQEVNEENNEVRHGVFNIDDAITIRERSRRNNQRYQAEEIIFEAGVIEERIPEDIRFQPFPNIWGIVRRLFSTLIMRASENLLPSDLMRFCIFSSVLDRPISTTLMRVDAFNADLILDIIDKVIQSALDINLDETFRVDIITIRRPVGAGRTRKVVNVTLDRMSKKSIISVPYDDEGLCCAKAIVLAMAHLEKDQRSINSLKDKRRPALLKRAR
ncbi:unnamed protein product [Larinioides sclopetarius]|uniref:Uncharacterized protein n=1 Tax=Larinioides sclopetarius TaxID=280406 RepID=A0AAV2AAA9_9ARAC